MAERARWWELRPAQGHQPKTYTCPLCQGRFMSTVPHVLLSPEGDRDRRRHAHLDCVKRRRADGKLVTKTEWQRDHETPASGKRPWWRRMTGGAERRTPDGGEGPDGAAGAWTAETVRGQQSWRVPGVQAAVVGLITLYAGCGLYACLYLWGDGEPPRAPFVATVAGACACAVWLWRVGPGRSARVPLVASCLVLAAGVTQVLDGRGLLVASVLVLGGTAIVGWSRWANAQRDLDRTARD